MQKQSFKAAVIFVLCCIVASVLARQFMPQNMFSDPVLSSHHVTNKQFAALAPGDTVATVGLRHPVPTTLQKAVLVSVLSADTILVNTEGLTQKVRLAGIVAPRMTDEPSDADHISYGMRATEHLKSLLELGGMVYLQRDTSDIDANGSLLRYVWKVEPSSFTAPHEVIAKMVNAAMINDGYALARKFKPDDAYFTILRAAQLDAYHNHRGLWSSGKKWARDL